jgi:hypothetical protein
MRNECQPEFLKNAAHESYFVRKKEIQSSKRGESGSLFTKRLTNFLRSSLGRAALSKA